MSEPGSPAVDEVVQDFLRLCLRGRWEAEALEAARLLGEQAHLDWKALVQVANEGWLAPLFHHVVRGQDLVPPEVEGTLRAARHRNALRERLLRGELVTILDRLAAQGVDILLLKGAALAETAYGGGVGLRPMGDLDLLVRREDAGLTLRMLGELGYQPAEMEARAGANLAYENEVILSRDGLVDFSVEVHWSLFDSPYHQQRLPMAWFWKTAQGVQIEGRPAWVLGPEAQILHLCGHLLLHHGRGEEARLLWLHDVAEVLVREQDQIDWEELLDRAQAYALVLAVQRVLTRVAEEWGAPIPAEALARLGEMRASAEEAQILAWRTAERRPAAQRFWTDLASMDGWDRRLHYACIHLFPSPAYMRQRYGIRHRLLVPLYYPYRWLVGLSGAPELR